MKRKNTTTPAAAGQQRGTPAAIDMGGVGVLRDGRWILRDIDWTVSPGELVAVLGPNGSGKSTLARIAAGHLWPTAGDCSVLGEKFGQTSLPDLRRRIRLVQPTGPYDVDSSLSARDVVLTGFVGTLGLYEPVTPAMTREADRALSRVGLRIMRDHPYTSLSSGERVRNLIARALVSHPELLILDEPTSGLDLLGREQVLATIGALRQAPTSRRQSPPTVVLITHHVEELPPETSHVLLLDHGRPAAMGTMAGVLRKEILSRVYRMDIQVRRRAGRYYLEVHPAAWKGLLQSHARK